MVKAVAHRALEGVPVGAGSERGISLISRFLSPTRSIYVWLRIRFNQKNRYILEVFLKKM